MAYRNSLQEKWSDNWFSELDKNSKYLFLYLIDNCDIAGFIELSLKRWSYDTGLTQEEIKAAIEGLGRGLIGAYDKTVYFLKNFCKHQNNLPINPLNNAHFGIIKRFFEYSDKFNNSEILNIIKASSEGLNSPTCKSKSNSKSNDNYKLILDYFYSKLYNINSLKELYALSVECRENKNIIIEVKANEKQMLSGVKANEKQKESKEEKEVNELNEQIKENINKNKSSEQKNDDDFNSDKLIQKFNLLAETFSSAYKGVNQLYSKSSDTLKVLLADNKFEEKLFFQKLTLSAEQISNWSNAPIDINWCFKNTDNYYKIINGDYIKKIAVQIEDDPWADCEIVNPPKNWKGKK